MTGGGIGVRRYGQKLGPKKKKKTVLGRKKKEKTKGDKKK